jgi:protein disulfide-isomerase-like protein
MLVAAAVCMVISCAFVVASAVGDAAQNGVAEVTEMGTVVPDLTASSIVLGENNFTSFVTGYPLSLVLFYAPWCGHSKQFLPKFELLASELAEHSVPAAKVDCVEHKELYWSNDIEGFPQLKVFFGDGSYNKPVLYKGDRSLEDVVEFVKKQYQSSIIEPNLSQDDFSAFSSEFLKPVNPVLIMYSASGSDSDDKANRQRLEYICKQLDILRCAYSTDAALATDLGINPAMTKYVMIRSFEGEASIVSLAVPMSITGQKDTRSLAWVQQTAFPLLVEFQPANEPMMFSDNRPGYNVHVVTVLDSASEKFEQQSNLLRDLAKSGEFVGKCVFVYIDLSKRGTSYVDNILNDLEIRSNAGIIIVKSMKTMVQFFRYESDSDSLDKQSLHDWITRFQQQKLVASREINLRPDV